MIIKDVQLFFPKGWPGLGTHQCEVVAVSVLPDQCILQLKVIDDTSDNNPTHDQS